MDRDLNSDSQDVYDVIVCGAGSAGSTLAGLLAHEPGLQVLLLEAGGDDDDLRVSDPDRWPENLGTERDWAWMTEPNPALAGRSTLSSMGRGLGGGSSINVSTWARGHKTDWDRYAEETGEPAWSYESVLDAYRRIEDWHGAPDPHRRGTGGPMWVTQASEPHPFFLASLEGAEEAGLKRFDSPNGVMAETISGCALRDETVRDGRRASVYRNFVVPQLHRSNLTVLTGALVTRVLIESGRALGVEVVLDGTLRTIFARREVVLSLGTVQTPKVLMLSGVGPAEHLASNGIDVVQDLPGVGANLDDHVQFGCVWEATDEPLPPAAVGRAACFWGDGPEPGGPQFVAYQGAGVFVSPEVQAAYPLPPRGITFLVGMRGKSRGSVRLSGPAITDPLRIDNGYFSDPEDLTHAVESFAMVREIAESGPMRSFCAKAATPASLPESELPAYIRQAALTYWHQCGTAKMGTDEQSVVDGKLAVRGITGLRVADASVLPRVTSGNTMAPSVVVGERAAQFILATPAVAVHQGVFHDQ